jgi:hypothetical protein
MSVVIGRNAKVTLTMPTSGQTFGEAPSGTEYTVAELSNWTLAGYAVDLIETTAFGDTDKTWEIGFGDGGNLTLTGNYSPDDDTGQKELSDACYGKVKLQGLKLYLDDTQYWGVDFSLDDEAYFLVTTFGALAVDYAGVGKISFTCKVSGRLNKQTV